MGSMGQSAIRPLLLAGAGLTSIMWCTASAQAADAVVLEEIVVTAQKRSEKAQDVPIAITALSGDQLAIAGVTGTEDLKATVPSLNITVATAGFGLPRLRGIGSTGIGPGIENPVAVYVDGVYYGAAFSILQSLYDIDQVAVLKGPQGTLFGRNATGGLIQITTLGPSYAPTMRGELGYGNYDTVTAAGYVSGGLSDNVAVSLAAQYENRGDGLARNVFSGKDVQTARSRAVRGKLLWEPSELTEVILSADVNDRHSTEPAFRPFSRNTLGQDISQVVAAAGGDPERDIYADTEPLLRARQWGGSLTVSQDMDGVLLKSITAYRDSKLRTLFDPDGTVVKQLLVDINNFDEQFTQEVNLISDGEGPFKWVLGAFYMDGKASYDPQRTTGLFIFGNNGYSDNNGEVTLNSIAGFAEGIYALGESTNVTAGIRYTTDKRELTAQVVAFNGNINTTTTGPLVADERRFSKPSWKLSLDHRFSPELLAYASYNRGFRSGTFIAQASPLLALEPEVVDAYEVGFKSDLLDQRVRLNVAGYLYDETNIQVQQIIAGVQNVYNAKSARIYGVDADLTVQVTSDLRLFGGAAYTHARYGSFTNAIVSIPLPLPAGFIIPPGQTCRGTFGNPYTTPGGNCLLIGDATGNKLQNTPEFTFSIGGSWDIRTSAGKFTVAGNFYHNGGFFGDADNRAHQSSYETVDASLTWRHPGDNLFVRAWGKNLSDSFYLTQYGSSNSADNGTIAAPRTYGVTVGFDF